MRILDLTTLYIDGGEGGVNTYLREKARYFARRPGITHTAVVPGRANECSTLEESRLHKIKSPSLPGNPQHRVLTDIRRMTSLIQAIEPEVVEVDCSYFLGHLVLRALRPRTVPVVGFYHVHLPMLYSQNVRNPLRQSFTGCTQPVAWRYAQFCARPCQTVVVSSQDRYDRLQKRGFPNLELVPLGVNLGLFQPLGNRPRPSIAGVDPDRPVVLYVGRLSPEKDLAILFEAHRILRRSCGSQLVIAGDGPLKRRVQRLAGSSPDVIHVGLRDYGEELVRLYQAADVLAAPGANETFGLVILESLACGVPVVAASRGGPRELIGPGIGALAKPGDAADLATKMEQVLAAGRRAHACRRHVAERFSWDQTFGRLMGIYESLRSGQKGDAPVWARRA